ncbi:uncharacterized protein I303_103767 [Kwoniella dejecticola CBS 10117]|uniref:NmrA-like domain-containing protein n=1 Tax=Kwoniella dejecticola CBS 10117 TaxID=1296121 RepID=A0A1A6A7N7_9TREE|nr:uncharacterized protein I303_03785 [Kwoniella dejecticola CBS 10117]OBR86067.1 hypothetical protein I303_03785 [Kwoniella dejecticola CBS 10117]
MVSTPQQSTTVPTIGFLGYSGLVGKHILPELIKQHDLGTLDLVILHREASDLSLIPDHIERRTITLDAADLEKNREIVGDLDVVLSAVGAAGFEDQTHLIDALEGSKRLKTFIHSDFGVNFTSEELQTPGLKIVQIKETIIGYAKEKGVPLTSVRTGIFDLLVFMFFAAGTDIKNNKQLMFRDSLKNPLRITTLPYLGYAVAQLLTRPDQFTNQTVQLYDFAPSGQELVDALTDIKNRGPAEMTPYAEEDYQQDLKGDIKTAIRAAFRAKWGDDQWGASDVPPIQGWESQSLVDLIRSYA